MIYSNNYDTFKSNIKDKSILSKYHGHPNKIAHDRLAREVKRLIEEGSVIGLQDNSRIIDEQSEE